MSIKTHIRSHGCKSAVLLLGACLLVPGVAHAEQQIAAASPTVEAPNEFCAPGQSPVSLVEVASQSAKSVAILGGAESALDAIRSQQTTFDIGPLIPAAGPGPDKAVVAAASTSGAGNCNDRLFGNLVSRNGKILTPGKRSGEILGSHRVAIGKTHFDAAWKRVSADSLPAAIKAPAIAGGSQSREELLATVNQWVNARIAYVEDRALFGKADYWAGPSRTLALGKGDCEDYALLKMHVLEAAGVPREDMILTLARDLVRRADHAVLIVRTEAGYQMLDNATDTVLDAGEAMDYRPVLSFSGSRKWLHGYQPAGLTLSKGPVEGLVNRLEEVAQNAPLPGDDLDVADHSRNDG